MSDPDAVDENGRSELHHACRSEDLAWVKRCVEAGLDLERRDVLGWTPVVWAIDMASTSAVGVAEAIVEYLVEQGARLDFEPRPGESVVAFAEGVDPGVAACVRRLVAKG